MTRERKTPTNLRLSSETRAQIAHLADDWHMSQADVVAFAVGAVYRAVVEQHMATADAATDGGRHDPAALTGSAWRLRWRMRAHGGAEPPQVTQPSNQREAPR